MLHEKSRLIIFACARFRSFKIDVNRVMNHIAFRVFTILLILVDVIVVIVDLCHAGNTVALEVATLVLVIYFMVEVNLRLLIRG